MPRKRQRLSKRTRRLPRKSLLLRRHKFKSTYLSILVAVFADRYTSSSSSRFANLSSILSTAAASLFALFLISYLSSFIPARLGELNWYLKQSALFVQSAPLLIASAVFSIASILSSESPSKGAQVLGILRRIVRPLVLTTLCLIPILIALSLIFTYQNVRLSYSAQSRIASQARDSLTSINRTKSKDDFVNSLKQLGLGVDSPSLQELSLPELQAQSRAVINQQFNSRVIEIKTARRRRFTTDSIDSIKLISSWVVTTLFLVAVQRAAKSISIAPSNSMRSSR